MQNTRKIYLENSFINECDAIIQTSENGQIVLDQTVAFPEGGGQQGDEGYIEYVINNQKKQVRFIDTQKKNGELFLSEDFPTIRIRTTIYHILDFNDPNLKPGMKVKVVVNKGKRAQISVNHSGIHLVLMGFEKLRKNISQHIIGCHIKEENARLDFSIDKRINFEELKQIEEFVNNIIDRNLEIYTFAHAKEPEALFWKCGEFVLPCGGTHVETTRCIGNVELKRKNLGKRKERIIAFFNNSILPINKYKSL